MAGADPRAPVAALIGVLMLLVLPGLGLLVGRLTPTTEHLPASRRPLGLALLAAALVATMPLASSGHLGAILSIEIGDVVIGHFALAGIALLVALYLRDHAQFVGLFAAPGRSLLGAALGMIGIYVLLPALGPVSAPDRAHAGAHGRVRARQRWAACRSSSRCRRCCVGAGPCRQPSIAAGGRVLVLLVMIVGVVVGVLPPVVTLMLPALAIVFVLVEVMASVDLSRFAQPARDRVHRRGLAGADRGRDHAGAGVRSGFGTEAKMDGKFRSCCAGRRSRRASSIELDRERAVVLVTCSPLEVHGPHLPLGADVLEGEGLAERMLCFLPRAASRAHVPEAPVSSTPRRIPCRSRARSRSGRRPRLR